MYRAFVPLSVKQQKRRTKLQYDLKPSAYQGNISMTWCFLDGLLLMLLACSIRLVNHRLYYSSSSIYEPENRNKDRTLVFRNNEYENVTCVSNLKSKSLTVQLSKLVVPEHRA